MNSREKFIQRIKDVSKEGKISCHAAHELARELDVSVREVGKLINTLKLKIIACELGCF